MLGNVAGTICNLAPLYAKELVQAGAVRPVLSVLKAVVDAGDSDGVAEPLCWTLKWLARLSAYRAEIIESGGIVALQLALEKVSEERVACHARDALRMLRKGTVKEYR